MGDYLLHLQYDCSSFLLQQFLAFEKLVCVLSVNVVSSDFQELNC